AVPKDAMSTIPSSPGLADPRLASMSPDELRSSMRSLGYRTQNDLAQAIGVSRSAVSLWLEGKVGVPRPVAMLLRMLVHAQRRAYQPPGASPYCRGAGAGTVPPGAAPAAACEAARACSRSATVTTPS